MLKVSGWESEKVRKQFHTVGKSHFRKGGESLQRFQANRQVCPTFSEMTFANHSNFVSLQKSSCPVIHSENFGKGNESSF